MAETSRSHVTITLGRSGQVVKRAGGGDVGSDFNEMVLPPVGVKRSVRDRLGSNVDAQQQQQQLDTNKRQRGVNGRMGAKASIDVDDTHLSKHDLRFKIMKKSESQSKVKQKNVDLRDLLSRKPRPPLTNHKNQQSFSVPENGRQRATQRTPDRKDGQWDPGEVGQRDDRRLVRDPVEVGPRDDRRQLRDSVEVGPRDDRRMWAQVEAGQRDDRRIIRDSVEVGPRDDRRFIRDPVEVGPRDDRQPIRDPVEVGPRDDRRPIRVPIEVDPRMHKLYDDRQSKIDHPTDDRMPSRLASTRTSRTLSQMDLSKTSFFDQRPSSHNVLDGSSGLQPPPLMDEPPLRRPLMSTFNEPRPMPYTSRDTLEIPRPVSTPFSIKPPISDGQLKPVGPLLAPQLQQSPYPIGYLTVEGFLRSLGLEKYLISFKVEEVDMLTLSQMGEIDLKEMGIPMGPRKKIVMALHPRNRRQVQ